MKARSAAMLGWLTLACLGPVIADDATNDPFKDWHRDWKVKQGVAKAQVIMVARVTHVGKVKVVEGAKTNQYFREFRFQPLEVIKGVYSRAELTMSDRDLGCGSATGFDAADVREGQVRLLLLTQSSPLLTTFGCASVSSTQNFRQAVPLVSGPDDPIVDMYKSLIRIDNLRSRRKRADALVETLERTDGPGLIPLISAIADDLIWAAANDEFATRLLKFSEHEDPVIAESGFDLVCKLPAWFTSKTDKRLVKSYAERIRKLVTANGVQDSKSRRNALRAAIRLEKLDESPWLTDLLIESVQGGRTAAEQNLAATGLGELKAGKALPVLKRKLQQLPLDARPDVERVLTRAIEQLDPQSLLDLIQVRFAETRLAGESLKHEVEVLSASDHDAAANILADALDDPRAAAVHGDIVTALGQTEDARAVETLASVLRNRPDLRSHAIHALIKIGNKAAAVELRPHLKTNRQLLEKLLIAEVLARHGIDDGYPIAIEHLADGGPVTLSAAEVLREIDRPDSKQQLLDILRKRPDKKWYLGSIAGLLAMENEEGRKAFLEIVSDDRHPLLSSALELGSLAGKEIMIENAPDLMESRNAHIAMSAIGEIKKTVDEDRTDVAIRDPDDANQVNENAERKLLESLTRVVSDSYIDPKVRLSALDLMTRYDTDLIESALVDLADRVDLVGRKAMTAAQNEIKEREIDLSDVE